MSNEPTMLSNWVPPGLPNTREYSEQEIAQLRVILTSHANKIPHHGIVDFGSKLDRVKGQIIPVFGLLLQSLFETRTYERREMPYSGSPIPTLQTTEINLDIWLFIYPVEEEFREATYEHVIVDSQSVSDCSLCAAMGNVTCYQCNGKTIVQCPQCNGNSVVTCSSCDGKGVVQECVTEQREDRCTGSFFTGRCSGGRLIKTIQQENSLTVRNFITDEACPVCKGSGLVNNKFKRYYDVNCANCNQKGCVECGMCSAIGTVDCSVCNGGGSVTCSKCEGQKRNVSYLIIKQGFYHSLASGNVAATEVDSSMAEKLKASDFSLLLEYSDRMLPADPEASPELKTGIAVVAQRIRQYVKQSQDVIDEFTRIAKQRLSIGMAEIRCANYVYLGNEYSAWFVGTNESILDKSNPFAETVERKLKEAIVLWKGDNRKSATAVYQQCKDMGKYDRSCQTVIDRTAAQMPIGLKASTVMAAGLAAVAKGIHFIVSSPALIVLLMVAMVACFCGCGGGILLLIMGKR